MDRTRRHFVAAAVIIVAVACLSVGATVAARAIVRHADAVRADLASIRTYAENAFAGTLPVAPERRRVSMVFTGDVMLDRNVAARIQNAKDDLYPFRDIMGDTRFTDADLQILNLEGPVTDVRRAPQKSIDFMFDPRLLTALREVGFDVASQANNHALDQGRIGADDSKRRLYNAGFIAFGDEVRDGPADAMATTTLYGLRIAFVGFNTASSPMEEADALETLKAANAEADVVIVFMHWGAEYRSRPTRDQEDTARWMIDNGADIVIGAHPHWTQSVSSYKGKPILYSLGNFVFDQDWSVETREGLVARVVLSDTEVAIDLHPVFVERSRPRFLDGAEREERLRELADVSDAALMHQILQGRVTFGRE